MSRTSMSLSMTNRAQLNMSVRFEKDDNHKQMMTFHVVEQFWRMAETQNTLVLELELADTLLFENFRFIATSISFKNQN
jgi:hypothetical protein